MIVSNEPGYYKEGAYGIRIENLQVVTAPRRDRRRRAADAGLRDPDPGPHRPRADRRRRCSTAEELAQLDAYHARVLAVIGPKVEPDVRAWLEEACAPL